MICLPVEDIETCLQADLDMGETGPRARVAENSATSFDKCHFYSVFSLTVQLISYFT